jgi:putative membrane protein
MHPSAEAIVLAPALAVGLAVAARGGAIPRQRVAAGALGVVLVFAAFFTQLEPLANRTFLWAHLLQNVVLAEWAPVLLVLAIPPRVADRAARFPLFQPLVALPLWLVAYYTWHLPAIYDAALRRPHSLLHVEHLTYLLAGVCVWWPVVHGRSSAGAKAAYLFAAFVLASPLGLLLALIPRAIYPFYVHAPRTWGPRPLVDQQIAGVTMATEEAIVFFGAFTAYLLRFLADEQAGGLLSPSARAQAPDARHEPRRIGAGRFELPASRPQTGRSDQAELRPATTQSTSVSPTR